MVLGSHGWTLLASWISLYLPYRGISIYIPVDKNTRRCGTSFKKGKLHINQKKNAPISIVCDLLNISFSISMSRFRTCCFVLWFEQFWPCFVAARNRIQQHDTWLLRGCVEQRTQHITQYYSILQSTLLLRTTQQYYSGLQGTTKSHKILHSITTYYKVLLWATKYYKVLRNTTVYCKVLHSIAK